MTSYPSAQGLYRPIFEHDACGIGFYVNIKGNPTHDIVEKAIDMLKRLDHRAGHTDEGGDGAGILIQLPDAFFRESVAFSLPKKGDYAVGMLFMPQDLEQIGLIKTVFKEEMERLSLSLLGWRDVPVDPSSIPPLAQNHQPAIKQVFIGKAGPMEEQQFERQLYALRRLIEKRLLSAGEQGFYVASLSSQTIVYKGMVTPDALPAFYQDLNQSSFTSALAFVHSRFSTNTFPSWERAHPYRTLIHNGEINTLRGNVNWMKARETQFKTDVFGLPLEELTPIIDERGSDSSMLDNAVEFLTLTGRSLAQVAMMLVPEPWEDDRHSESLKNFYEYHSAIMEPWDGPMALALTNGKQIAALLDRNGLRPGRYYLTDDDQLIYSSEFGVIDVAPEKVIEKRHLRPGEMLFIDLEKGEIIANDLLKSEIATANPYKTWIEENVQFLEDKQEAVSEPFAYELPELIQIQKAFGYTHEEVDKNIMPMVSEGKDPIGAMGIDTPLAVLSERPSLLFNYFKQWFAQVTNPPIDAIREECVTSTTTWLGPEGDLLNPNETNAKRIKLETPFLTRNQFKQIHAHQRAGFTAESLSTLVLVIPGERTFKEALDRLFKSAVQAIDEGASLLILSDRGVKESAVSMPILLALSGLHHHLIEQGLRTKASIIVDTGEARDVHHMAMLLGYGADAIHPYLGIQTLLSPQSNHLFDELSDLEIERIYLETLVSGVVKVMSKMGISTIQSYRGAQTFEAIGISEDVINTYFKGTVTQLGGVTLNEIEEETLKRHLQAFESDNQREPVLESGSAMQWRPQGEDHRFNPKTIHLLQQAARRNDYETYKKFAQLADDERWYNIRNLFAFKKGIASIPLEEVEPVESIFRRFKTGAMSFGALSQEAHEALAIAMNRIGGKSNSGEGGEDEARYKLDANGDNRRSAIKQVASGRFGVSSHYLSEAEEIQIKMAQGAKPGEGGQLPSHKVYPWIAEVRHSTPGVGLISPPPHHDIYSIEDLAQLIYDLKRSNPKARINVKLVSKAGVGTIAAGVAKGLADVILISGFDGGTGASPRSSIMHAGLPWELGLAETHQTLLLNGLRSRVVVEADGKLMTGRDVILAALLGAEEFGFSTAPLVVLGCIMMRACHLDTCPVGVATQNPELRKLMTGSPDHVVNYLTFIAEEMREYMAALGIRTIDELVGRTELLEIRDEIKNHPKAQHLQLEQLLYQPTVNMNWKEERKKQDHQIEETFDVKEVLPYVQESLEAQTPVQLERKVSNTDRTIGTMLGYEISTKYGAEGLPDNTIELTLTGSAGQSLGAFVPKGVTIKVVGDANDYFGKGLSGGRLIIRPDLRMKQPDGQKLVGNVVFYGATAGEAFIRGGAGERFAVRNSGIQAVVEGIGDHGCEYMTGGTVVVLGEVGRNFGAGMSGGVAYLLKESLNEEFLNMSGLLMESLTEEDTATVQALLKKHVDYTDSPMAAYLLSILETSQPFIKIIPKEFKQMRELMAQFEEEGLSGYDAKLKAFYQSMGNHKETPPIVTTFEPV
ncbi:glutamate synthase large subunit [Pullulanibacillus sp. KACC 23026]|uniref:glutamate synthase large subunit n=1 Tax=Pullulanibacillus sp. KACC 23026 TaxID=3028315 RepID=UPI0023B0C783|nr:glutamate synthase large subunit [Pullulanibacillus sp. KACC 23026]WEG13742.1 glutamate synthase large subunit [Pullulanibacillus sp. KACC 23026]